MRLIDKDDLILTILTNDLCDDDNVDKAILNAPIVKAITVEWIEKWVDTLKERNYHSYQVLMPALIEMLGTWEKENEQV